SWARPGVASTTNVVSKRRHLRSNILGTWTRSPIRQGRINDCEAVFLRNKVDISDAENTTQPLRGNLHGPGGWSATGRRLRERCRHCRVESNIPFHLLHDLMDVTI